MEDLSGRTLGSYRLEALLGEGGMGAVYRAIHLGLGQPRAIKLLDPRLAADPLFVERFQREAQVAAGLKHPQVVQIYDVGQQDGLHYIVMELVTGRPLGDLLRLGRPLPLSRALRILEQLASALDYAHSRGVVHRDVKPGNVLVGPDDRVTLVDFGIARAAEQSRLTRLGSVVGTMEYLAPETLTSGETGPSADLYALGVVAYALLVGRTPFGGATLAEIAHAQVHTPPPPPRSLNPSLPPRLEQALLRQLAKDPAERYPQAASFVAALAEGQAETRPAHEPSGATVVYQPSATSAPAPPPTAMHGAVGGPPPGPTGAATVPPSAPPAAPAARPRLALLGVGAALIAAVAFSAFFFTHEAESPAPTPTARSAAAATSTSPATASPAPAVTVVAPASPAPATTAPAPASPAPATAAPAPAASPSPPPRLRTVFEERFLDNRHGWVNQPEQTAWLGEGVYRLFGRVPIGAVAVGAPLRERLRDVVVQGRFRKVGGPPGGGYGLIVRDAGPGPRDGVNQIGNFYVLEVGDLGEYGIWRRERDRWVDIIPWTRHPALRPGGEPNELMVTAFGPRLTLIVNGVQIAAVEDSNLSEGGVGFYSGGDLNEVAVERFVVQVPE